MTNMTNRIVKVEGMVDALPRGRGGDESHDSGKAPARGRALQLALVALENVEAALLIAQEDELAAHLLHRARRALQELLFLEAGGRG